MALSPDIVGLSYTYPDYYEVGVQEIRQYAAAVKSEDPSHYYEDAARALGHPSVLAPLTFIAIFGLRAQMAFLDHANIPIQDEEIVQVEQGLRMLQPIKAGDRLYCHIRLASLRQAFGADVLTIRSRIINQHGETIQEDYTTMAGRSSATMTTA